MPDLLDLALPGTIAERSASTGLDPSRIDLEITESVFMSTPTGCAACSTILSEMGVGLSIDDFGTGYSSLAYL